MRKRVTRSRLVLWLSVVALAITALIVASSGRQQFSTTLPAEGRFSVEITRHQFFPRACATLSWESSGLEQILLNGSVIGERGTIETCGRGDVLSTFLIVAKDFQHAEYHTFRTPGASGIVGAALGVAVILTALSIGYERWTRARRTQPRKEAPRSTSTYHVKDIALKVVLMAGALAALQSVFLILFRESPVTWLTYWLYLTLGVILPGTLLLMRFTRWQTDILTWIALGWALGHAIELFSLQIAKFTGTPTLFLLWIPAAYVLVAISKTDWTSRMRPLTGRWQPGVLFLLVATGAIFIILNVPELSPRPAYISDVWFHINNTHEFRDFAVTQDPRLAGEPFNYHMFGYAPYAAASLATGAPIANLLTRFGGLSAVWLLTLLLFTVGRELGRDSIAAGFIAALLMVVPVDLLALFSVSLSTSASLMYFGVYVSSTTLAGHIYLVAMLLPILWYFRGHSLRDCWAIPLFAAAGAGSKSMFGVLVICGLLGTYGLDFLRTWRLNSRTLPLLIIVTIPTVVITAQLVFGPGSYSESVRWVYANFGGFTRFYEAFSPYLGDTVTRTLWLIGFGGLFIAGAWIATREKRAASDFGYLSFLWMMFIASLIPAMGIALIGASQLFFLYSSLAGLASIAGYGLVLLIRRILSSNDIRLTTAFAALTLLLIAQFLFVPPNLPFDEEYLPIIPAFSRAYYWLPYAFESDSTVPRAAPRDEGQDTYFVMLNMTDDLRAGLEWARLNLPRDTVFVANVREASAYAGLSEHRAFYETERFSVHAHVADGPSKHFAARRELMDDWQAGEADVLERMREVGITHLFVDSVNGFSVSNTEALSSVFQNGDIAIYALSPSSSIKGVT